MFSSGSGLNPYEPNGWQLKSLLKLKIEPLKNHIFLEPQLNKQNMLGKNDNSHLKVVKKIIGKT